MNQLLLLVGEINGKVDGVLKEQERIGRYIASVDKRVSAVENRVSGLVGWAVGAGACAAFLVDFLFKVIL